jgi:hypothetical protein
LAGRIEILGFGLGENFQNVNQVTRGAPNCLWGPRKIEAAGNRRHLWREQHRIEPRTKRNHWWANLGCLTSDDYFSRSPYVLPRSTLAKSFSEFQENTFVVRIAELRLGPLPDATFRFENTVFHLPGPDRQRLVLFAEHGLEEGFYQYVH